MQTFNEGKDKGAMPAQVTQVISRDPNILDGIPVFANTSVPFQKLLKYFEGGKTLDEFLRDFPEVKREVAITALEQVEALVLVQLDRSRRKIADRPHFITTIFSVLTSLLSVIALVASFRSCQQSQKITRITEEKAAPLVYDTEAGLRKKPLAANSRLYVAFQLKNQGETPAYNIRTEYNLKLLPKDQELVKDYEGGDSNEEPRLANQDWTLINYRRDQPLSADEVIRINRGDLKIWLFGKTDYEDSSRKRRTFEWCWYYNPELEEFWRCD
jgi:uncharacterized protein (DUF433 family)